MGLKGKIGAEIEIHSPASKFFNIFITRIPEIHNMTDEVHQTKLHKGDDWHGVGSHSVKHWTFSSDGKVVNCKEHIEGIDHANKIVLFNIFDGYISERYKMLKVKCKVVEKGEGAIAKWSAQYEKVNEGIPPPQDHLDFLTKLTKDVDAHLFKA